MTTRGHHGLLMGAGSGGGSDPYIASRVSIVNLNTDLTDAKGKVWTPNGGVAVSSGWLNLDGTNDYLSTPDSADFDFASGDFCVEAFVNIDSTGSGERAVVARWGSSGDESWLFGIDASGRASYYYRTSTGLVFKNGPTPSTNTDLHMAWYRVAGDGYFAVNGVVTGAGGVLGIEARAVPATIGATSLPNGYFKGKVRGVRITKGGTGGYGASNFTPPSFPLPTS